MCEGATKPLASILSLVCDRTSSRKDPSKPYVGLEHIPSGGLSLTTLGTADDSVSTNNVFAAGDILFGKLRPRLRKSVRARLSGYCSTDILVLRPTGTTDPAFAALVAQSDAVFSAAIRTEEGTKMPRCSWRDLRSIEVYCPGNARDQHRIAAIVAAIDTAIEQTEALIEKYQQIKAGLMHDLFTRGVLPNGQLRPPREQAPELYRETAIGWIPTEWGLTRLGLMAKIVSGVTLGAKEDPADTIDAPCLRVANVQDGYLDLSEIKTVRISRTALEYLRLQPGDVLMNEAVPETAEQQVIVGRLHIANRRISTLETDAAKLRKQKAGLMQDLLTGKVPVKVGAGETAHD